MSGAATVSRVVRYGNVFGWRMARMHFGWFHVDDGDPESCHGGVSVHVGGGVSYVGIPDGEEVARLEVAEGERFAAVIGKRGWIPSGRSATLAWIVRQYEIGWWPIGW